MAKLATLLPLIVLVVVVAILAAVAFVVYSIAHDVGHHTRVKLERKNVSFSRDGMKVGVKEVTVEQQEDATQSVITKIWNHSSWPNYQSRLGWGQGNKTPGSTPSAEKKNPFSRHSSSTASVPTLSRNSSSTTNLSRTTSAQTNPPPASRTTSTQSVRKA